MGVASKNPARFRPLHEHESLRRFKEECKAANIVVFSRESRKKTQEFLTSKYNKLLTFIHVEAII